MELMCCLCVESKRPINTFVDYFTFLDAIRKIDEYVGDNVLVNCRGDYKYDRESGAFLIPINVNSMANARRLAVEINEILERDFSIGEVIGRASVAENEGG